MLLSNTLLEKCRLNQTAQNTLKKERKKERRKEIGKPITKKQQAKILQEKNCGAPFTYALPQ